jgi:hypothetical protein
MKKHSESEASILNRARPLMDQHSIEIQPYGTIAKLPIALAEDVCKASVENLNQLLADTIGRSQARLFINFTCSTTSITKSRANSWTPWRSESKR